MYRCPRCHIELQKGDRGHHCTTCGFEVPYVFRGHRLSESEITNLLERKSTGNASHWQTKDGGRKISGELILTDEFRLRFEIERITYAKCPRCKSMLYRFSHGIACSSCDFVLFEKIAKRTLTNAEMMRLLLYKRTDVIDRFVSSESGKYFSARLYFDEAGDIQFDFTL